MLHQNTAWPAHPAVVPARSDDRAADLVAVPAVLAHALLIVASLVLLALACASAWLSYHAQVAYVLVHNGGQHAQARVWALLLDTGTAGVSLLRLHETLRNRPSLATRASLFGCIAASVTMNLLHSPSHAPGGYLVAAVPPVMYAVFLEHLLTNLRSLLLAHERRRSLWRTLTLWVNFPAPMWNERRRSLRRTVQGELAASETFRSTAFQQHEPAEDDHEVKQHDEASDVARRASGSCPRRGRGPGPKRVAFEIALAEQVRSGDLRLFSPDERERNLAAYEAAASLPVPLSRGAARRYVVQALPRLDIVDPAFETLAPGT